MLEKFFDFSQSFLFFNIIFYPKNLIFWAKFSFLTKISIFEVWSLYLKQKLAFICKRSSFFTNNWTFHQNLHFCPKFRPKIRLFLQILLSPKFRLLRKLLFCTTITNYFNIILIWYDYDYERIIFSGTWNSLMVFSLK